MLPLVWFFICVVVIMGLAYLTAKYVAGHGFPGAFAATRRGMLQVIAQLPLGRDRQVILVQAGDRYLLLGSTEKDIRLLAELTPEEIEAWREKERQMGEEGQPPSFAQSLQEILKSRRNRGD